MFISIASRNNCDVVDRGLLYTSPLTLGKNLNSHALRYTKPVSVYSISFGTFFCRDSAIVRASCCNISATFSEQLPQASQEYVRRALIQVFTNFNLTGNRREFIRKHECCQFHICVCSYHLGTLRLYYTDKKMLFVFHSGFAGQKTKNG